MSEKPSKDNILQAIEKSHGIVTRAASQLGVARSTVYAWLAEDPDLEEAVRDARERLVDLLEEEAIRLALDLENKSLLTFLLERLGRDRGYGKTDARPEPGEIVLDLIPPVDEEEDKDPTP